MAWYGAFTPKQSKSQPARLGCVTSVFCALSQQVIKRKIQDLAHNTSHPGEDKYPHHYKLYQPSNVFCLLPSSISLKSCINWHCLLELLPFIGTDSERYKEFAHLFILYASSSIISSVLASVSFTDIKKKSECMYTCRSAWTVKCGRPERENSFWLSIYYWKAEDEFYCSVQLLSKAAMCTFSFHRKIVWILFLFFFLNILLQGDIWMEKGLIKGLWSCKAWNFVGSFMCLFGFKLNKVII